MNTRPRCHSCNAAESKWRMTKNKNQNAISEIYGIQCHIHAHKPIPRQELSNEIFFVTWIAPVKHFCCSISGCSSLMYLCLLLLFFFTSLFIVYLPSILYEVFLIRCRLKRNTHSGDLNRLKKWQKDNVNKRRERERQKSRRRRKEEAIQQRTKPMIITYV